MAALIHAAPVSLRFYSPFELRLAEEAVRLITADVDACYFGTPGEPPWLFDRSGAAYPFLVAERSLEFKFEVFSFELLTPSELRDRHARWTAPALPNDVPEELRALICTRPEPLAPPTPTEPWPFRSWRVDVLKRVEFIVEGVSATGAVGESPNAQGAARHGELPPDAAAACDVTAALLFTDVGGERLLIGVDWMPYHTVVSRDPAEIDEYLASCMAEPVESDGGR